MSAKTSAFCISQIVFGFLCIASNLLLFFVILSEKKLRQSQRFIAGSALGSAFLGAGFISFYMRIMLITDLTETLEPKQCFIQSPQITFYVLGDTILAISVFSSSVESIIYCKEYYLYLITSTVVVSERNQLGFMDYNQMLNSSRLLATSLQDKENGLNHMIASMRRLYSTVVGLKEYKDCVSELDSASAASNRFALIDNLKQENRQIRFLEEDNRQLLQMLKEHQAALDLIMQRYREQIRELRRNKEAETAIASQIFAARQSRNLRDFEKLVNYLVAFDSCIRDGEKASAADLEELARLRLENSVLRKVIFESTDLKISSEKEK
ncbi:FGFR1 oncogene partner [Trichinella pseudospiralis]